MQEEEEVRAEAEPSELGAYWSDESRKLDDVSGSIKRLEGSFADNIEEALRLLKNGFAELIKHMLDVKERLVENSTQIRGCEDRLKNQITTSEANTNSKIDEVRGQLDRIERKLERG